MKTAIRFTAIAFAVFILSSCEDVIQVKLDQGSKLYVIDAFVNDLRSDQLIRVTTNDNYFSNRQAPPVTTANVVLKDLTNNTQYNFNYLDNGYYVHALSPADTIARINHQYQLDVTIDGVTYTSLSTQRRTAGIDSIHAEYNEGGGFGPSNSPFYFCTLYAKDKTDNSTDYYWIKTFRNDTLFDSSGDINLAIDGTGGAVLNLNVDSTSFTPPATFLSFKTYQAGDKCKVEIHSISHDTYFFLTQAVAQIDNGGLFARTPENVKTNIITPSGAATRAVGWFNMAAVSSKTKIVP